MAFALPLAMIAGGIGAGVSAIGAIEGGQATKNAADYSAQVARNNEQIANANAEYAIASGQRKAADVSMKGAATAGRVKTAQAASGIDVNTGSAVDVQEGDREVSKLDAETTLNNAELQAYGYRSHATNFKAESQLDEAKGDQAVTGSEFAAAGGLLSSASSLRFKWSTAGA